MSPLHPQAVDVVVVTGMSGSGKSTAVNALEDRGFYCIDNLPCALVPRFVDLCAEAGEDMAHVGLGLDRRDSSYVEAWPRVREELEDRGHRVTVIFLDASDEALVRRFSETRRPHPAGQEHSLQGALREERVSLADLRAAADLIFDTTGTTVHELKAAISEAIGSRSAAQGPTITIKSFGYKYGLVTDADLVFDVRFIPNPYFVDSLRSLTGQNEDVAAFVLERTDTSSFLVQLMSMLSFLLPRYASEGKAYLT
ncbi:MAG: RNase adapter RapZ, partial [Candidatus Binatia bacterium]